MRNRRSSNVPVREGSFDISAVRLISQWVFFLALAMALYALDRTSKTQESG